MRPHATRWLLFVGAALVALSTPFATGLALAAEPAGTSTTLPASTTTTAAAVPATPVLTRYDQTAGEISYSGTWSTVKRTAASAHTYLRSKDAGASVSIAFNGTRLDWIATQVTRGGSADVYLDGAFVKTISLARSATAYQSHMWSTGTLAGGVHTVRIVRSAGSATGAYISIDAVDVAGTVVPCQWVAQGDSLLASEGSSVTASFTGTYLAWMGQKDAAPGTAKVTVDGAWTVDVGLGAAADLYQQKLWGTGQLAPGEHTVKIDWAAAASASAAAGSAAPGTGAAPTAGFLVVGKMTQSYVWRHLEDTDPRVLSWGAWTANPVTGASGGSDKRAAAAQSMVTVTFTGKELVWLATTGPGLGDADVSVDSGAARLVHLSGAVAAYQQKVWTTGTLAAGTHTVQISWDKNSTPGAAINVDAFEVLGTLPATTDVDALRIMWAEQKLADLSYRPGPIDGVIDRETKGAITAFQKWEGLSRDRKLGEKVFARLLTATRPTPGKTGAGDTWIEVNKAKQVLLYCKAGAVVWTIPVSTGSPSVGYETPSRTYKITRKTLETNPRWHPLYISPRGRYLAIHGYPSVPTQRASHACIRTQIWDQRELYPLIAVGTTVYVY